MKLLQEGEENGGQKTEGRRRMTGERSEDEIDQSGDRVRNKVTAEL